MKGSIGFTFSLHVFVVVLISVFALSIFNDSGATDYQYDDNGRLVSVGSDNGETAQYVYDALGNIVRITRKGGPQIAISALSPNHGTPGTQVLITGTGFGATTAANTIRFNGVAAPVLSASATQLLAMVPFNASTGRVTVTANGATATSAENFVISTVGDAPVITAIAPTTGPFGTVVTITGAHLNPIPGQTAVRINGIGLVTTTLDDQQITVTIPPYVGSGRFEITTAFGATQSNEIFYILPAGISPSSLAVNATIQPDGPPQSIDLATNQYAVLYFDGIQGDYLSLQASSFSSSGNVSYNITSPTGTVVASGNVSQASPSVHLPPLNVSGIFSVVLGAGANAAKLGFSVQRNAALILDGAPTTISAPVPVQTQRFLFTATAGKNLGLDIGGLTVTGASSAGSYPVYFRVYRPDGGTLIDYLLCYPSPSSCDLTLTNLPLAGTYSVVVQPYYSTQTLSFSFAAIASHEVTGILTPNTPFNVNISRRGQSGRLTFSGNAGSTVAVRIGGITTAPTGGSLALAVLRPDGTSLTSASATAGTTFYLANLPTTGTYTLLINPSGGATANLTASLVPSLSVAVPVDGAAGVAIGTTTSSQPVYFTFAGTAGENLGLGIGGLTIADTSSPPSTYASLTVYRPDGVALSSTACVNGYCGINLLNLPSSGTYGVVVQPAPYGTGTLNFTAAVSHDAAGTLVPNTPLAVNLARLGQNGRLSFQGTAGSAVGLQIGGITTNPSNQAVSLTVLRPNGTSLSGTRVSAGTTLNLANLPETGTYSVFIDPDSGATGTLTATLVPIQSVVLPTDNARAFSTTLSGQGTYFSFTGTAGENLGLGINGLQITGGATYAYVQIYQPNGNSLALVTCYPSNSGCDVNLNSLPVSGTYSVLVYPGSSFGTLNFTATVSHEAAGALSPNAPLNLSLSGYGQNGRLTFQGAAAASMALQITNLTTTPTGRSLAVTIYRPDGTIYQSATTTRPSFDFPDQLAAGTYTVFIDPQYGATANLTVALVPSQSIVMSADGNSTSVATSTSGQTAYVSFVAVAGENLGLGLADLAVSDSQTNATSTYASFTVYRPDGYALMSGDCLPSTGGCGVSLINLPTSGTYGVLVRPNYATGVLSFTATLSHAVAGALAPNTPFSLSISRRGQKGRLTFSANAGGTVALQVGGIAITSPQYGLYQYLGLMLQVLDPSGAPIASASANTSYIFNLTNLPSTGTYTLVIEPYYGETANLTATLQ
jgi:YD repeat-containing protein